MRESFTRLGFALLLIIAAAVLLWSDRHSRQGPVPSAAIERLPVALLQHSSKPLLDETRQGVLDGLSAHGFRDGAQLALTVYNPEGDLPTGNLMAQKIAVGGYRLAISLSTVMLQALAISVELGLTLLEAPVEQIKDVREAAESLVARGAEAFWTGGDVTVNNAVDSLIGVARNAHLPVFSNIPGHAKRGGLFDLRANYYDVGKEIGRIAGDILAGADPARIPVRDYLPRRILLNEQARLGLAV